MVQFVLQDSEKWQSYEGLNITDTTKTGGKIENLMSHFWEATQVAKVKFLLVTYVHLDYPQTEFRPYPRGSLRNLGELIYMELPFCYTFYSNYGRFAWFITSYSANLPEITQDYTSNTACLSSSHCHTPFTV